MSDSYALLLSAAAKKRLRRHKHAEADILRALVGLKAEPERGHELTGTLRGFRALKIFLKCSGEYRALYEVIESEKTVRVHWIGTRENFYDEAERFLFG